MTYCTYLVLPSNNCKLSTYIRLVIFSRFAITNAWTDKQTNYLRIWSYSDRNCGVITVQHIMLSLSFQPVLFEVLNLENCFCSGTRHCLQNQRHITCSSSSLFCWAAYRTERTTSFKYVCTSNWGWPDDANWKYTYYIHIGTYICIYSSNQNIINVVHMCTHIFGTYISTYKWAQRTTSITP